MTFAEVRAHPDWNIPPGLAGDRLARVVLELARRWEVKRRENCRLNLPLLADLLDDCELHYEAAAARLPWSLWDDKYLSCSRITGRSVTAYEQCVYNRRRIFWFAPRTLDVSWSNDNTRQLWWFGNVRCHGNLCTHPHDLLHAFAMEETR